ncbi:MAG: hypothetical protein GSR85_06200 [Desulfurococcales archaeon]|nr:hypothetical protein [Desulfurococcales archaeon]
MIERVVEVLIYVTLVASLAVPLIYSFGVRRVRVHLAIAFASTILYTIAGVILLSLAGNGQVRFYNGLVVHDSFTSAMVLGSGLTALLVLMSIERKASYWSTHPALYSLLPLTLFGVFYLAGAMDTLVVLAGWLLVSVISYVIVALPDDLDSAVASSRYIMVGAVATLLIGLWAASNVVVASSVGLEGFRLSSYTDDKISALAFTAIIAALGFKVGVAPFHWWLPSVYGRGDGRVIAVVAGIAKLGFIAVIARIIVEASRSPLAYAGVPASKYIAAGLAALAVATMTYGNIAALTPRNVQAILAYSSIAQVGYILVGLSAAAYFADTSPEATSIALAAVALQSIAYALAKAPLFAMIPEAGRDLADLKKLAARGRGVTLAVMMLILSLLGLPPLLGFWGKLYLFLAAAGYSLLLVAIALVNSGISSAYYIRMIREMLRTEQAGEKAEITDTTEASLIIAAILITLLGITAPLLIQSFAPTI